jgi:predicted amidohydrolase YtcJ
MTHTVRVPKRFYQDHIERECPAPPIVRETKRHLFVNGESPHCAELLNDARYYTDMDDGNWTDPVSMRPIINSAWATKRALLAAGITDSNEAMEASMVEEKESA